MIEREERGAVAVVRLAHGKANALDVELLAALEAAFAELERGPARAVVLTGAGRMFSAGLDLVRLVDGGPGYIRELLPRLDAAVMRIAAFPRPVVAAVNGHAIAGGCILACAADLRLLARGPARIGVPELQVGVPFPPLVIELLRHTLPARGLAVRVLTGDTLDAEAALAAGLADELVDPERLLDRALEAAAALGAVPAASFESTKRELRRPLLEAARAARERAPAVWRLWEAPETIAAVRGYVERTLRRPPA